MISGGIFSQNVSASEKSKKVMEAHLEGTLSKPGDSVPISISKAYETKYVKFVSSTDETLIVYTDSHVIKGAFVRSGVMDINVPVKFTGNGTLTFDDYEYKDASAEPKTYDSGIRSVYDVTIDGPVINYNLDYVATPITIYGKLTIQNGKININEGKGANYMDIYANEELTINDGKILIKYVDTKIDKDKIDFESPFLTRESANINGGSIYIIIPEGLKGLFPKDIVGVYNPYNDPDVKPIIEISKNAKIITGSSEAEILEKIKKEEAAGKSANVNANANVSRFTYKNLKKVTIGKNVRSIGANAFYGDKKLSKIVIKSKVIKKAGNKKVKVK